MAQAVVVRDRAAAAFPLGPIIGLVGVAVLATLADLAIGAGAWFFMVAALLVLALVMARPEVGIAVFLSTFLVTYPSVLAGAGYLTINNVLGLVFLVLLAHRVYSTGDWWFARNPEMLLFGLIVLSYLASGYFNGPDPRLLQLIGPSERNEAMRLFVNRVAFVLFVINFIRTPAHIRLIYMLAISLMVASGLVGLYGALSGGGLYGYRASTFIWIIAASGNPNRLAMFSIISMGALWYLSQQVYSRVGRALLIATIVALVLAVFMAASRSGLLALSACVLFILADEGASPRRVLGLVAAGVLAVVLVLQFVPEKSLERATTLPGTERAETGVGSGSLERRRYTLSVGYEIVSENVLLGVGVGNWEITRFLRDPGRYTAPPHNSYLLAMAEGGLFCLLGFVGLFWRTWGNLSTARRLLPPPRQLRDINWMVSGARVGLIAVVVFSMFADLWQAIPLFWLVGLGVTMRRYAEARSYATA
ncbi:MAG: O-antigen ligase family protein [Deltaproteobacteria bacterium]|nr:O-antigen ligase family protein [Deltaproteobacteria bacterium]